MTNNKYNLNNSFNITNIREATELEKIFFNDFFPEKIGRPLKYLGKGVEALKSNSLKDPMCKIYSCLKIKELNLSYKNDKQICGPNIQSTSSSEAICTNNQHSHNLIISDWDYYGDPKIKILCKNFSCSTKDSVVITYNCIGWALGISQLIEPFSATNNPQKAIKDFILDLRHNYPENHHNNVLNIIDRLDLDNISKTPINSDNSIAFYMSKGRFNHLARYIKKLDNGYELNSWTSKWGIEEGIFAHEVDHMLNNKHKWAYTDVYFANLKSGELALESESSIL